MSRHDAERLNDILTAVGAIADHTSRGGLDRAGTITDDLPPLVAARGVVVRGPTADAGCAQKRLGPTLCRGCSRQAD